MPSQNPWCARGFCGLCAGVGAVPLTVEEGERRGLWCSGHGSGVYGSAAASTTLDEGDRLLCKSSGGRPKHHGQQVLAASPACYPSMLPKHASLPARTSMRQPICWPTHQPPMLTSHQKPYPPVASCQPASLVDQPTDASPTSHLLLISYPC